MSYRKPKKLPANQQLHGLSMLILGTELSDRRISLQGYGSRAKSARVRKRLDELNLSAEKVKNLELNELWSLIYPKKKERYRRRLPDWADVYQKMQKRHQTLLNLWIAYRDEKPLSAYSYTQFSSLYRKFVKKVDITMRMVHRAGERVFVDFAGRGIFYKENGKLRKAQIFVAVAGASNYTFVRAVRDQKKSSWISVHIAMFDFFGGVFEVIVPDNLKAAVIKTGDFPVLNKSYLELANHYGCVIEPARVRKPQDKAKVEAGVLFISRAVIAPLSSREFNSLDEINEAIEELLPAFNDRNFKRIPGTRTSRFNEIDRPVLKSLPTKPFIYMEWHGRQKVPKDYHIYFQDHAYSVPYQHVAEHVDIRFNDTSVEVMFNNKLVATHKRSYEKGGCTTDIAHMPEEHKKFSQQSREDFMKWAFPIGDYVLKTVQLQFDTRQEKSNPAASVCSKLQKLEKLYGPERLDESCRRAFELNSVTIKTIEAMLRKKPGNMVAPDPVPSGPVISHANMRGANYYRNKGAIL